MPDGYGFDHLPFRGQVIHRCIECEWPGWGVNVSEADRQRHSRAHAKQTAKQKEAERLANLAKARRLKAQAARENSRVYPSEGEA